MEEARILFYSVKKCGYYKRGQKTSAFGNLSEAVTALSQWVQGKPLGETCTYQVKDDDAHDRTYCFKLVRLKTGSSLLVLWNESPSAEGNVATVDAAATVGSAAISLTEIPPNSIPGYATYFWIIPDRQLIATVSFHHRISGYHPLYKYMRGFLRSFFAPHVVFGEPEDGSGDDQLVVGYRETDQSPVMSLTPSFHMSLVEHPGQIQLIKSRRTEIKKIVRKDDLLPNHNEDSSLIKKLLISLGIQNPHTAPTEYRIKYELGFSPDEDELNEIIESWKTSSESESGEADWNDVGFVFSGESAPHWLSHSVERQVIELEVERDNEELVNPGSLLKALEVKRKFLLRNIK